MQATDGRNFYYNTRFIDMLKPKEVEFLFGHEVLHCVYDHMGRRGDRDPQLWNVADDYCANAEAMADGDVVIELKADADAYGVQGTGDDLL